MLAHSFTLVPLRHCCRGGVCLCLFWLRLAWLYIYACVFLLMDREVGLALFSWWHIHYLGVKSSEVYFLLCHLSKYHRVYITRPASLRTPVFPWRESDVFRLDCGGDREKGRGFYRDSRERLVVVLMKRRKAKYQWLCVFSQSSSWKYCISPSKN